MKNTILASLALAVLLLTVLGCSSVNPFSSEKAASNSSSSSNKTLTDKAVDTTVGEEKIGIAECDEAIDIITAEMNNPDDNFIVKAGKAVVLNKIKQSIKDSVEQNKNDKAELAKNCGEFKKELEKFKAEQDAKSGQ